MISVADMSLHTIPVDDSHSVFYESTVTLAPGQLYKWITSFLTSANPLPKSR